MCLVPLWCCKATASTHIWHKVSRFLKSFKLLLPLPSLHPLSVLLSLLPFHIFTTIIIIFSFLHSPCNPLPLWVSRFFSFPKLQAAISSLTGTFFHFHFFYSFNFFFFFLFYFISCAATAASFSLFPSPSDFYMHNNFPSFMITVRKAFTLLNVRKNLVKCN